MGRRGNGKMKRQQQPNARARGFSLVELMIVIAIIGILVGVGVPAWRSAVIAGNETAAIQNLRNIATEQRTYFNMNGRNGYATFDQLQIDPNFRGDAPVVEGYVYTLKIVPKSASSPPSFTLNADPQSKDGIGATGKRHFYIDSNIGNVRTNPSGPAGPNDTGDGGDAAPAEAAK